MTREIFFRIPPEIDERPAGIPPDNDDRGEAMRCG
jgi:hypothetical protein